MKSGLKTTEFYGRAIVSVVGLLVGAGVIQPEVGEHLKSATDAAVPIVQAIIDGIVQLTGIITAAVLQFQQGKERANLKMMDLKRQALQRK